MIAIHDGDCGLSTFPNLALMKVAAHFRKQGEIVEWFDPFHDYDLLFSSSVFTFSKKDVHLPPDAVRGGTGYGAFFDLPNEIDTETPDYSIYPSADFAIGFLTRGCPNKCPWCIVPKKEGGVKAYDTWENIKRPESRDIVFMDNNVLASEHGLDQIDRLAFAKHGKQKVRVDFNQGLDARLIIPSVAKALGKLKWIRFVRLACDTKSQMPHIDRAVAYLKESGVPKSSFACYVLVKDIEDALERVEFLRRIGVEPFAQPYRDFETNTEPSEESKAFARWVNHKATFKTCSWKEYREHRKV